MDGFDAKKFEQECREFYEEKYVVEDGRLIEVSFWVEDLVIPDGVKEIKGNILKESKIKSIFIPASVEKIDEYFLSGAYDLMYINVAEDNIVFSSDGDCLLSKDGKTLLFGCKNSIIPNGVERIADHAFDRSGIQKIVIPNGVREIGVGVFDYCKNLESISMPESLMKIGDCYSDFIDSLKEEGYDNIILNWSDLTQNDTKIYYRGCENLQKIEIDSNNPYFTIEDGLFIVKKWMIL